MKRLKKVFEKDTDFFPSYYKIMLVYYFFFLKLVSASARCFNRFSSLFEYLNGFWIAEMTLDMTLTFCWLYVSFQVRSKTVAINTQGLHIKRNRAQLEHSHFNTRCSTDFFFNQLEHYIRGKLLFIFISNKIWMIG